MKNNDKKKEVQRKYREEIKKKKQKNEDNKNFIKETIIVVTIIVLFIFSHTLCKVFNKKPSFPISILCNFPHNKRSIFLHENIKET